MKKIDIHCHTTNRRVEGLLDEYPTLKVIKDYMKEYDIEKTVLLATYFPHKGTGISNFRLLNWIDGKKEFLMFGSLDFDHFYLQGLNELSELAERKLMQGIKIYTCYQHIDLHSEKLKNLVNLAKNFHMPMMFHVGYSYSCMSKHGKVAYTDPINAKNLEFLALENPELNFIFSHMGKPFIDELVSVVKSTGNVYSDNSGLMDSCSDGEEDLAGAIEDITRFVGECGPDRLVFGTDFPVQSHRHSVYMIETAMNGFSKSDKNKVYYENARRLLNLK